VVAQAIFPDAEERVSAGMRTREADYRAFFEAGGAGHVITDLESGRFLTVNDAFCALTGYSRRELVGMSGLDLTHADDRWRDRRGWNEALARGDERYTIEKRYVRRDGSEVRVLVVSTLIRDETGEPVRAAGTICELPGSPAPDGALHRISGAVIAASPVAVIALDRTRRVEIWNPEAARLLGLSAEAARGHRLLDLPLKWRSPDAVDALLDLPAHEHVSLEVETRDRVLELSIWCAPFSRDGGSHDGHVLLALDETEKKFLERALLDAGEREQRRLGQELHEGLCQQLMGATFVAQALFRELERDHSPCAERAGGLARLLSDSVQQGRNIARGINPVEIDSAGLMCALQDFSDRLRAGAHIEMRCDRPVLVHSAEAALHVFRIAQEAAGLALSQAGATRILIRLDEADGQAILQVSDNGAGDRDAGVGLGIMKYRAQAIHGELAVESTPGSGTTVTCVFPNNRQHAQD
jgi:PAS domain S-box-containing protein